MPVGNDPGYLWRLNLYTRYLEKDNGVYIEIEFVALSRNVPRDLCLAGQPVPSFHPKGVSDELHPCDAERPVTSQCFLRHSPTGNPPRLESAG